MSDTQIEYQIVKQAQKHKYVCIGQSSECFDCLYGVVFDLQKLNLSITKKCFNPHMVCKVQIAIL